MYLAKKENLKVKIICSCLDFSFSASLLLILPQDKLANFRPELQFLEQAIEVVEIAIKMVQNAKSIVMKVQAKNLQLKTQFTN